MAKRAAGKALGLGKATVVPMVVAVMLVVVFGASPASAHGGYKGLLHLGHNNAIAKVTTLVGKVATGAALVVKNPSGGSALGLEVNAGQAPLTVNAEAGTATNLSADKLDGKDPGQLPGSIASTTTINNFPGIPFDLGGTGSVNEVIPWKFVGNPETGITTTSSQRLVGTAEVPMGDPTPTGIDYDLCYRPSGGSTITPFSASSSSATLTSFDVVYTATSSVVPGAGTWDVGFCVRPAAGGRNAERINDVNGWVQVVNE